MSDQVHVGIDPGLEGAVCVVGATGDLLDWCDTPTLEVVNGKSTKREYADPMMAKILGGIRDRWDVQRVALEKVHSMPEQGVASSFHFGVGFGLWRGIIAAMGLRLELVPPQRWKRALMADMGREKDASRLRALQLWPGQAEVFKLKKHHGRSDAALIAEWARRLG